MGATKPCKHSALRQPMRVGDVVTAGGQGGRVVSIRGNNVEVEYDETPRDPTPRVGGAMSRKPIVRQIGSTGVERQVIERTPEPIR